MFVPSWQQLPSQRTIQQPLLSDSESWSRSLVLERATLLPDQPAIIPVELHESAVYEHLRDRSAHLNPLLPQQAAALAAPNLQQSWGVVTANSNSSHCALIPTRQSQSSSKLLGGAINVNTSSKRQTKLRPGKEKDISNCQLSPVKKRVKESSPPKWENSQSQQIVHNLQSSQTCCPPVSNWEISRSSKTQESRSKLIVPVSEKEHQRPTIIIHDTPSPVVSVITISSDSDEEVESSICCDKKKCKACDSNKLSKSSSLNISAAEVSSTTNCASVLPLTPEDQSSLCCVQPSSKQNRYTSINHGTTQPQRKNVISCVTVPDSDSEGYYSPLQALPHFTSTVIGKVIKPEPQKEKTSTQATSQKKRLLAKVQSQTDSEEQTQYTRRNSLIVPTKQEIIAEDEYNEQPHSSTNNYPESSHVQTSASPGQLISLPSRYIAAGTEKDTYQYYSKQQVQNLEGEKLIKCSSSPLRNKEQKNVGACSTHVNSRGTTSGRHGPSVTSAHLSPLQHVGQPLYLTTQPDLYRDYCRPAVYVTSNLSHQTYLPAASQTQKYVLTPGQISSASFSATQLPVPPPAHHHHSSSRSSITTAVPYAAAHSSSHPLPAHLQPASANPATAVLPASAVSIAPFPSAQALAPPPYSYSLNPLSPAKASYNYLY
ncbi:homeodomain-interacting protein kinase 2-like isoform X1 [Stegodyphus dumicola]|uniref:homeodomain-interacting protein kinase 2-like isoform X1 n=1 Tax=Stegodyphus dumicola TaxID=202533 RepID=UPI0015AD2CB9|nr:homeodomain-interacting protein kinase 2-like isoform X1 [Stegodyphus dumicola]